MSQIYCIASRALVRVRSVRIRRAHRPGSECTYCPRQRLQRCLDFDKHGSLLMDLSFLRALHRREGFDCSTRSVVADRSRPRPRARENQIGLVIYFCRGHAPQHFS